MSLPYPSRYLSRADRRLSCLACSVAAVLLAACSGDTREPTAPASAAPAVSAAAAPIGRATLTASGRFYDGPLEPGIDSATMARMLAHARAMGFDTLGPGRSVPPHFPEALTRASRAAPAAPAATAAPVGSFGVDFDDLEGPSGAPVYLQYVDRGIVFSGAYQKRASPAFPASAGQEWLITGPTYFWLGMTFFEGPVDEVSLVVTSPYALMINCEGFRPDGSYGSLVVFELPGRSASTPLDPYPTRETIRLAAPGIFHCSVLGRGGSYAIDDVQWRRGPSGPSVALACVGDDGATAIVRGETVHCRANVLPETQEFTLLGWASVGADGYSYSEGSGEPMDAGATATWSGPAVLDTRVTVEIQIPGRSDTLRQTAAFTVAPRQWQTRITRRPRLIFAADSDMPEPSDTMSSLDGVFGEMDLWPEVPSYESLGGAGTGPNAIWLYVKHPLPPTDPVARVNGRLQAHHRWYQAQDGHRRAGARKHTCSARDLEELKQHVLEHEGVVSANRPNHFDVWVRELPVNDFAPDVERLALHALEHGGIQALADEVGRIRRAWAARMDTLHFQQVDALDRLKISCSFNVPPSSR